MKNKKTLAEAMSQSTKKDIIIKKEKSSYSSDEVKKIIITLTPEAHYQLKKLALEERSNIQTLGKEALNDLFIKYKQSPIV
jgi:hypothetical protein